MAYVATIPNCGLSGLGCPDCGGTCKGLGIFDSGLDLSGWGIAEWALVILGGYMLVSTAITTKRAARAVSGNVRKSRRRAKKRRDLENELNQL